jgi:excisionase family DNA binding protein
MTASTNLEHRHETLDGHIIIEKALTPEQRDFLARVRRTAADPTVTVDELTNLVWSEVNPLLVTNLLPGRAMATRETYDNPAFHEMLDWIGRKRVATGDLDLERARARYTMTVPDAAELLGVAESTLRRAVKEHRLAGWKKGGVYYLDPTAVESFRVSTRGVRAEVRIDEKPARHIWKDREWVRGALSMRLGTEGDYLLRVKGAVVTPYRNANSKAPAWEGLVPPGWKRIAVLRGKKKENDYRFFILEPASHANHQEADLEFSDFFIRGDFRIVRKINNPRKAIAAWESFEVA